LGCEPAKTLIHKVIMLGPANFGTFAAALGLAGAFNAIPGCAMFNCIASRVQPVEATFTSLYLLLPWNHDLVPSLKCPDFDVRRQSFWANLASLTIQHDRLAVAFPGGGTDPWGRKIDTTCFNKQTSVILGSHPYRKTPGGVEFVDGELTVNSKFLLDGDGWVPDVLARLDGTKTYRAPFTGHIRLPMANSVINAVLNILNCRKDVGLPEVWPLARTVFKNPRDSGLLTRYASPA
jgi:hypothetical protein